MSRSRSSRRLSLLVGFAGAALVAGCAIGPNPSRQPSAAEPGSTAGASPAAPTGGPPVPSEAAPRPWGPLAIIPPQAGSDTALLQGTLRITESCVFLDAGDAYLLFWPADRTRWLSEVNAITFRNSDETLVTVRTGDRVAVGGSGDTSAESGVSGPDWVERLAPVARPHPSCSLDVRWVVGALSRDG